MRHEPLPIGANVVAKWNEPVESLPFPAYISFGDYDEDLQADTHGIRDDIILYYVDGESELRSLMEPTENPDDFIVLEYELAYGEN